MLFARILELLPCLSPHILLEQTHCQCMHITRLLLKLSLQVRAVDFLMTRLAQRYQVIKLCVRAQVLVIDVMHLYISSAPA